jgi:hypothetical protein
MKAHPAFYFALIALFTAPCLRPILPQPPQKAVKVSESTVTILIYEHPGRELEPPLFSASTLRFVPPPKLSFRLHLRQR